ncbi:MAG: ABC transporter ATP-binding protein [Tropicimonas sp.]|uniref:ABC transporter ATP-binding protein n=1 Tax=Tropicimonas sp. TaxID=2067044 RepID=UPI003A8675E1
MIALEDIHVRFNAGTPLETHALRGVSLEVPGGQFVTVIGSNGAGKSTSLNAIAGVIPVASGRVLLDGRDVTALPPHRRARQVSRVFQDPKMGTCEDLTILENFALAYGRTRPRGFRFATSHTMREEVAERVSVLGLGLENRLGDKVGLLSGGQRQAVSLLMATTGETQVLLLDEHTAALDPKTADFVLGVTRDVVARLELTAVMVTHSMAQALETGDRTVMFHGGNVIFDRSGAERDALGVADLLELFKSSQGTELSDDSLLLG